MQWLFAEFRSMELWKYEYSLLGREICILYSKYAQYEYSIRIKFGILVYLEITIVFDRIHRVTDKRTKIRGRIQAFRAFLSSLFYFLLCFNMHELNLYCIVT